MVKIYAKTDTEMVKRQGSLLVEYGLEFQLYHKILNRSYFDSSMDMFQNLALLLE